MEIIYLIAGVLLGLVIGWLLSARKIQNLFDQKLALERERAEQALIALTKSSAECNAMADKLAQQKTEIDDLQRRLMLEFENIANRVLRQNSSEFRDTNLKTLGDIISPLKERIQLFEKQVQDTYNLELRDKVSLQQEVRSLFELNQKLRE